MTDDLPDGIMCGLEIHQQLDTGKLFCRCPSELTEQVTGTFERALKPVRSELGEVDPAALSEARKGKRFRYQVSDNVCLVEADEEPPHDLDDDALTVALQMAAFMEMEPVDEVQVMRKIVIDGSNTTGFQRTCLVATGGRIATDAGDVGLQTLCLEEDAARIVEETGDTVTYKLDRLGIPLVEIATDPDITGPEQAREAAARIGELLRATGRVKRGLGTIRQDLNVSIPEGARVEVKGVQTLDLIPEIVADEARRQRHLAELAKTLSERVEPDAIADEPVDVSDRFAGTSSDMVASALDRGEVVQAVALPGFDGALGGGPHRLGKELAAHARTAGVQGILHSDELPTLGIDETEVEAVADALALDDDDAFALVVADAEPGRAALARVVERARQAVRGVPEETRQALDDGHTRYLRPLPGEARMYPETDVPPVRVTHDRMAAIRDDLPERPEAKRERFADAYDLSDEVVDQLLSTGRADRFETLAEGRDRDGLVAELLLQRLPDRDLDAVPDATVAEALDLVEAGEIAADALPDVIEAMAGGRSAEEAVDALGLETLSRDDLAEMADALIADRADFVDERGMEAVGPLMGPLMEQVRGRADGSLVSEVLRERLQAHLEG